VAYNGRVVDWIVYMQGREWSSYFDYIVIDANKPRFFAEGNTLREIDPVSRNIGVVYQAPLPTVELM